MHNYTTYMVSYGEISLFGADVSGPRLGICAGNVTIVDTRIDSSGYGCKSDQGLGRGHQSGHCGGSGGSSAGIGGYGGMIVAEDENSDDALKCADHYPKAYALPDASYFEGSGGASGLSSENSGGAGGGIIRVSAIDDLIMQRSSILSNGLPGEQFGLGSASGGGAGGSIEIVTRTLRGDSKVEVRGGNGSQGGGGGGSGGRLIVSFLRGQSPVADSRYYWSGSHSLAGGISGKSFPALGEEFYSGENGQEGLTIASKCFGGMSGPFCAPCPAGTFKYDFSYAECQRCENKPH